MILVSFFIGQSLNLWPKLCNEFKANALTLFDVVVGRKEKESILIKDIPLRF